MLVELFADERATNQMPASNRHVNGNSEEVSVHGYNTVCFQVSGVLGGATVKFQGSCGGGEWFDLLATNVTSGVAAVSATANGIYRAVCSGLKLVRVVFSNAAPAVEKTETEQYTIVDATGVITFTGGNIPGASARVLVTYDYTLPVVGEALGIGDGVIDTYTFARGKIITTTDVVKLDAVTKTRGVDYTITDATGEIVFAVAPGEGVVITGDCTNQITATLEEVGTGDGTTAAFTVDNKPVVSQTVFVDTTVANVKTVTTN